MNFPSLKPFVSIVSIFQIFAWNAVPSFVFAEETATTPPKVALKYVLKGADFYDLFVENRPTDAADLKVYDGATMLTGVTLEYRPNGSVRVYGHRPSFGEFSVERYALVRDSDGVSSKKPESKSSAIRFYDPQKTFLKAEVRREETKGTSAYSIPVEFWIENPVFSGALASASWVRPKYSVSVNGLSDWPLEADTAPAYGSWHAYVSYGKLLFHEASFPDAVNTVTLKVDGIPSNYVTVRKNTDIIGALIGLEFDEGTENPAITLKAENARSIKDLSFYEFRVNGNLVPSQGLASTGSNSVSTGFWYSGPLTFRIFPSSLGEGEHSLRIEAKEKSSLSTDTEIFDLKDALVPTIRSVETLKNGPVAKMKVGMNPFSLFGDYEKIKITLNGAEYSSRWIKTTLTNPDGTVRKDVNGFESYEFKNRLDFTKTSLGLEFEFPLSELKEKDNTLSIENANSRRTSETAYFDLGSSAVRTSEANVEPRGESVTFAKSEKNLFEYDPSSWSGAVVSLGTFATADLQNGVRYRFSGKFVLASGENPFARFGFWNSTRPASVSTEWGETIFAFLEEGVGGSLPTSYEANVQIHPSFVLTGSTGLELREFRLEKLTPSGFETVSKGAPLKGSVSHFSSFPGCFDAQTDVCGKDGLPKDAFAKFSFAFGWTPLPAVSPVAVSDSNAPSVKKRNDPYRLTLPSNSGNLAKAVYVKFSATMEKMKMKLASDPKAKEKLSKLKKAFEQSVASAARYEKETVTKTKAFLKKTLVSDLKSAIKSVSEVSK